jgi:hypothetical protein
MMSRWSTHCTVACRLSLSVRHLGGGLNLNMNPRARAFALAAPSPCSCRCCFCCLALCSLPPFVINQPQTSDKRHLSCSHHTTHPSNTTSSSFIEISPSVLSCVHGRSILTAQLRRFSFILRAQANSAVPPRSYLLLRTTFDTSSTLDA